MRNWLERMRNAGGWWHALFWSWNAIFVAVACFGLVPTILWPLAREALDGFVPANLMFAALVVVLVPIACTAFALLALRKKPTHLVRLLYGFEAPLLVIALARLFLVRQLQPAVGAWLLVLGIGCASFLVGLQREEAPRRPGAHVLVFLGDMVGLGGALHLGALLTFFAVPLGVALGREMLRVNTWKSLWHAIAHFHLGVDSLVGAGAAVLVIYSATLFVALPFVYIALHVAQFKRGLTRFAARFGRWPAAVFVGVVIASGLGLFSLVNRQPQKHAFAALAHPPRDDAERRARLADAERIRAGLVNAYLQPYRYLGTKGSDHGAVRELCREVLHLSAKRARAVQSAFDVLAQPLIFEGQDADHQRAAEAYRAFFDRSIQKGEQAEILAALSSTYEASRREAGLLDAGERKVHLASQDVRLRVRGGVGEVEIHEVYENRTQDEQEIFYYFSLPSSAVVTGLWLGDSDDRGRRFAATVAPRGAAQKVYRREVARRVDPALVEQVGPRQYRLRAFPVPPRGAHYSGRGAGGLVPEGRVLHLWLTYEVLPERGEWPLPRLAERRNVFWDRTTHRTVEGLEIASAGDEWLPQRLPAVGIEPITSRVVALPGGEAMRVTPAPTVAPPPSSGGAWAVVVDRSQSMALQADAVKEALAFLAERVAPQSDVDLYLTAAPSRGENAVRVEEPAAVDAGEIVYYGGQSTIELLRQFRDLSRHKAYRAVIVLTDAGSLDVTEPERAKSEPPLIGAPLWMVHLGGLPAAYDDGTLAAMQASGGGATTSVKDAFAHIALAEQVPGFVDVSAGLVFAVAGRAGTAVEPEDPLSRIAARESVASRVRELRRGDLAGLDRLHALARTLGFVSPYSSMLVLVDDRQGEALRQAEGEHDRFEREAETGDKVLPPPPLAGGLSGTPEPDEWALIAVAAVALVALLRQRRRAGFQLAAE